MEEVERERETDRTLIKLLTWLPNKCPCSLPVHIGIPSFFGGGKKVTWKKTGEGRGSWKFLQLREF